jgi:5-deoxy-glucuronate isomerase
MRYPAVFAPPGYDLYWLNVVAGSVREWRIQSAPDHEWLLE